MNFITSITLRLLACAMVPVALTILFHYLQKLSPFSRLTQSVQQAIIGVFFGLAAVFGTEVGVDVGGAVANARDAAPLCAGLFFGGPAGIIAGIIGGVERYFAVYWGAGMYSRLACSVSTILAGFYAAMLRKYLFDNKRPSWGFGLATGVIMEVIHLTILFLTHVDNAEQAFSIVKICTVPMIACNSFAVGLAAFLLKLFSFSGRRDTAERSLKQSNKRKSKGIAEQVQSRLLIIVIAAFLITTLFVYLLMTNAEVNSTEKMLTMNLDDICKDINDRLLNKEPGTKDEVALVKVAALRHIGESGTLMILNKRLDPISVSTRFVFKGEIDYKNLLEGQSADQMFTARLDSNNFYLMYRQIGDMTVLIFTPFSEVFSQRDDMTYVNSYMEVLVFAVVFAAIFLIVKHLVVDNIRSVNRNLARIIDGDLNVKIEVDESEEFSSLSKDINSTVSTLKHYIDEAAARIDKELALAKTIQRSALPSVFPTDPAFELFATMDPAKEVGGDFYDFYKLDTGTLAFLIADVSGKGVPGAMFMMNAKAILKNCAETGLSVEEILTKANTELCAQNEAEMFVTVWMGVLDLKTGHLSYTSAGHNPPLLFRNGSWEYLKGQNDLVLAGLDGFRYHRHELDLQKGDKLFLYTDGVTEATSTSLELYGEERLQHYLNSREISALPALLHGLKQDIDLFTSGAEQFDDITMLAVEYKN